MTLNPLRQLLENDGINVSGQNYKVKPMEGLLDLYELLGQVRHYDHEMDIDSSLEQDDYVSTVIHEVIEVINRRYGMELNHSVITVLEVALFQFFKDNPVQILTMLREIHGDDTAKKQAERKIKRTQDRRVTRRRKVSDTRK